MKRLGIKEELINEGYLELEFKDKRKAIQAYKYINNKIWSGGSAPYEDFNQEGNTLQIDTDGNLNRRNQMLKDLKKELPRDLQFKVAVNEQVELEEGRMKELHMLIQQGKSAKEIAKIMKLDVKTIKSLMNSYVPEHANSKPHHHPHREADKYEDDDLKEKWKELDKLELSDHLINIKNEPTTFVTFPEGKFSDEITLPPLKIKVQPVQQSLNDEVVQLTKPDPFLNEKIPFQKEMVEIENNLNRSRDYRVIYYNSWYQPVFKENETIPIFIDAQKKDKKVHGEIKIYKERFIHLVSKLRFSQKTDEIDNSSRTQEIKTFQTLIKDKNETKNKGFLNDNYWVETIFNSVKVNLKYIGDFVYSDNEINSEEIINLPRFKFVDLYEIDKDVKLEVDELNFIDHPYFSILIKVTEQTK